MTDSEGSLHNDEPCSNLIQTFLVNVGVVGFFIVVGLLVLIAMATMGPPRLISPW